MRLGADNSNDYLQELLTEAEIKNHAKKLIDSLLHQESAIVDHYEASNIHPVQDTKGRSLIDNLTPKLENPRADISVINETFVKYLSRPRSEEYSAKLKQKARNDIINKFKKFGLKTFTQDFKSNCIGRPCSGINLIAIKEGFNSGKAGEEILLVGAHYDTVKTSPGVDDNGSGIVAVLEIARLLSLKRKALPHSIMLVAFDLEEMGLIGSLAFVREYLIPNVIERKGVKFLGAFILDMVLNYETSPKSQILPSDIISAIP
ncbi:hypothetical protein B4U79_16772, partial [Dinothrombium tinctorium]